jgi:hypothetical protein
VVEEVIWLLYTCSELAWRKYFPNRHFLFFEFIALWFFITLSRRREYFLRLLPKAFWVRYCWGCFQKVEMISDLSALVDWRNRACGSIQTVICQIGLIRIWATVRTTAFRFSAGANFSLRLTPGPALCFVLYSAGTGAWKYLLISI